MPPSLYDEDFRVTEEWFLPHFPPRKDRLAENVIYKLWKKWMNYEDYYDNFWTWRIAYLLSAAPRTLTVRSGRLATTFVVWLATNNGRAFLHDLFHEQKDLVDAQPYQKNNKAISFWAYQNQLRFHVVNPLEVLLQNEKGEAVYNNPPYPTLEDHRVVEMVCCFLVSDEGKEFLREFHKKAKLKFLPFV